MSYISIRKLVNYWKLILPLFFTSIRLNISTNAYTYFSYSGLYSYTVGGGKKFIISRLCIEKTTFNRSVQNCKISKLSFKSELIVNSFFI